MDQDHDTMIDEFAQLTNLPTSLARDILERNEWDLPTAMDAYYGSADADADDHDPVGSEGEEDTAPLSGPTQSAGTRSEDASQPAGRRLGTDSDITSASAIPSTSGPASSTRDTKAQPKKKFASLRDLQSDSQSHDHDDDSDKDQEYFAGGDKSGLAVQDPGSGHNQHIQRLLDRARRNGPPPPREESQSSHFSGQGQTLGGDDAPSTIIPDPNAGRNRPTEMVERTLHIWDDGFSIDEGPLHRYDDPNNRRTLEMINRGSAPLDLMNVEPGQAVDVKLAQHRGEKYVTPKHKHTPFSSGGQRLGSPVPGDAGIAPPPPTPIASTNSSTIPSTTATQVDDSQPSLTLQVRLADGTRMPSRFNTSHTIGDVYDFVNRASPGGAQRPYTLATTFPTKELTDKSQVLGDMAEFKRGGVVVQKWA